MIFSGNKKVFFLHPQAVVQDDLVRGLVEVNYEAYLLRNAANTKLVLKEYPDSILFIQTDTVMDSGDWLNYIEDLKSIPALNNLPVYVVSMHSLEEIKSNFLDESDLISRGISYANFDFETVFKEIDEILADEKARIPRNQVQGTFPDSARATIVFARNDIRYEGRLRDITISGLTCRLNQDALLPSDIPVPAIIISHGNLQFTVSGRVAGSHGDSDRIHLILFDEHCLEQTKGNIYELIHQCMQEEIKALIASKEQKRNVVTKIPRSKLYGRK